MINYFLTCTEMSNTWKFLLELSSFIYEFILGPTGAERQGLLDPTNYPKSQG